MVKKLTNIKERILYYSKSQGLSIENFLASIDMTYGSFKGEAKKRSLNSTAIEKILTIYKDINPIWLLTGEGEMCKNEQNPVSRAGELGIDSQGKSELSNTMFVPLVSKYSYREFSENFENDEYIKSLNLVPWINDFQIESRFFKTFEVKGDRMDDNSPYGFLDGDLLLCAEVEKNNHNRIHKSKSNYVILHKFEGVFICRIIDYGIENNCLQCHNLNEFYPDFSLKLTEILKIYRVVELKREPRF